jgi:signal transduction histidine kinase
VIVYGPVTATQLHVIGRSIASVNAPAAQPPLADFPTRGARWIAFGAVVGLIAFGLARKLQGASPAVAIPAAVVAVAACAVMLQPRSRPLLPSAALAIAAVAVLGNGTSSNIGWFTVCIVSAWCVLAGPLWAGVVCWAGAMVVFVAEWVFVQADPGWGAWLGGTTLSALGAYLIRHEVELLAQLRQAQAGLAERATAEERNRIARELHDVIAHTLTVSLLHVTSARLAVEHDPADAARALAEAERLGRESLAEVRSAVGLLRQDERDSRTAPLPGVDRIDALIDQSRAAGTDVEFRSSGDPDRVPATVGLALYRILQESLTNAIKHAPGEPVAVELAVDSASCRLSIDSSGAPRSGHGLGLMGMRERAASVGGTLAAGPGGRGWLVQVTLPVAERQREPAP